MGRRAINHSAVVEAASWIADENGADSLSIASVADRLEIKAPSLYNHIQNLESLRRDVALAATLDLGERLRDAVMGRVGADALREAGTAFRSYAKDHAGLYELTAEARPNDDEYAAASLRAVEPVLAILRSFGLEWDQSVHAARLLRSALHGFVSLENHGGFGLEVNVDESFDWLLDSLAISMSDTARRHQNPE